MLWNKSDYLKRKVFRMKNNYFMQLPKTEICKTVIRYIIAPVHQKRTTFKKQ